MTGWCEVGDSCRMTGDGGRVGADPLPTRRVLPPSMANSSSSIDISPSERATVRMRGDPLPSLKACKLACAFSRSLIIISCIFGGPLSKSFQPREMEMNRTRTFSALKPRAALEKSAHAESSCTSADGARLREGQRVTIDPRIIYSERLILCQI
jgi:hypothetical protein